MLNQVRRIFSPPVFPEDEDKTRKAKYANAILIAFLGIAIVYETIYRAAIRYTDVALLDLIAIGLAAICIVGLAFLRRGYVQLTSILLVVLVWLASNGIAATGYGARDSSYIINFAIVLMAGLLLSWRAALIVTLLSVISGFALAFAEQNGLIIAASYPITGFAFDITIVFVLNGVLIFLLIDGLEQALKRSRMNLQELESANTNLSFTQNELQNRTTDLVIANRQ